MNNYLGWKQKPTNSPKPSLQWLERKSAISAARSIDPYEVDKESAKQRVKSLLLKL